MTTTSPLTSIGLSAFILHKNSRGSITPSEPSPSIPSGNDFGDPVAIRTAEKPFFKRDLKSLISLFISILIPKPLIQSISLFKTLSGNLYLGIA